MNFEIKEATPKDISRGLLDVFVEGYRFHQKGRPDIFADISKDDLEKNLIKSFETYSILTISIDGVVVGYISYKIKDKHSKKLYVDQLVIKKEYQGKGLGKRLIEKVKEIARKSDCERIELDCWLFNESALAMYEHVGFNRQRIIYEMPLKTD